MIGDGILTFAWAVAKATMIARDTGLRQRVRRCTCRVVDEPHFTIVPADVPSSL